MSGADCEFTGTLLKLLITCFHYGMLIKFNEVHVLAIVKCPVPGQGGHWKSIDDQCWQLGYKPL